jgi:putative transposase
MKVDAKQRKKARKGVTQVYGNEDLAARMGHVLQIGKKGLDSLVMDLGRMLAETIMDMEREERSGPEGKPLHQGVYKWT